MDEDTEMGCLKEKDVYILKFLNLHTKPIGGILKHRYSDFQVNEISEDGTVIHLTSLTVPNEETKTVVEDKIPENINRDLWLKISTLMDNPKEIVKIDVTDRDKNERTSMHKSIKSNFGGKIKTCTESTLDGKKYINCSAGAIDGRKWAPWPQDCPQFLHFVVYKENVDTGSIVHYLSKKLCIRTDSICYAGTKDRRGITTQQFCIRRGCPKKLAGLNGNNHVWFGNYEFKHLGLFLGQLKGNRFKIILRNVEASDQVINETLASLQQKGFVNYYGLQRFGSFSNAPTYMIGKHLLLKNWRTAISYILKAGPITKYADLAAAYKIWDKEGDCDKAYRCIKMRCVEKTILKVLAKQGSNAYVNALQMIPRNTRSLYTRAYQSFVWNKIVSRRVQEFGSHPIVGDLVFDTDLVIEEEGKVPNVKFLTTENLDQTTPNDIVYPLPGYAILYPKNVISTWYEEILAEDGVSNINTETKGPFTSKGAYRKAFAACENFTWKIIKYEDRDADLLQSDLQILQKENFTKISHIGSLKGILLEFNLPSSSYATMVVREITKEDTSGCYQQRREKRNVAPAEANVSKKIMKVE